MPKPRKALVLLEETPYYHCVSRCVRRAFLCGLDSHTGESYEHRRQWIVDWMKQLAAEWTDHEVIEHWGRLFSVPVVVQARRVSLRKNAIRFLNC